MHASPGFADPVLDSQRVFRAVLSALSRPGTPVPVASDLAPPAPLNVAQAAIALTLLDLDTPAWLDPVAATDEVADWLRFHCGCPLVADPAKAAFALLADSAGVSELGRFHPGDAEFPDRSATLIAAISGIGCGRTVTLRGPGIEGKTTVALDGLPDEFDLRWADNHALYPLGVDLILAAPETIVGLPRSTKMER
jgi:alpha-D-ribose 1-methylphosphonate 5-triphosphate synthase subunit PhnH